MEKQELLDILEQFKSEIREEITKGDQGVARSLKSEIKNISPPPEETEDVETLKSQLEQERTARAELESQLNEWQEQKFRSDRDMALNQLVGSLNVVNPQTLKKLFLYENGEAIQQKDGNWVLTEQDGDTPLSEAMEQFLQSEDAVLFQPPSGVQGAGSKPSKTRTPNSKPANDDDALLAAFSNI
jgi:predicted RNase H-like nuclease (RuvC/YqgF family)